MSNDNLHPDVDAELHGALAQLPQPQRSASFFDDLRVELESVTPEAPEIQKRSIRRVVFRAMPAAVASVAAVALVVLALPRLADDNQQNVAVPTTGSATPTSVLDNAVLAAEVIASGTGKFGTVESVSGTLRTRTVYFDGTDGTATTSTEFRTTSAGDLWQNITCDDTKQTFQLSYRASDGDLRVLADGRCNIMFGNFVYAGLITPLVATSDKPVGAESKGAVDFPTLARLGDLGSLVSTLRSMAETSDAAKLDDVTYDGRPAWKLSAAVSPGFWDYPSANRVEVTVDKATSFPVHAVRFNNDAVVTEITANDFRVNPTFTPEQLLVQFPANADIRHDTPMYQRVPLNDVGSARTAVGYAPVVPSTLPDGFTLSTVSTAGYIGASGSEGQNKINKNVVWLTYRRGLQTIVITTRSSDNGGTPWVDPFGYAGEKAAEEPVATLRAGSFTGAKAHVVVNTSTNPRLWAVGSNLVVTVMGDASKADLVSIAESLHVDGAGA